MAELIVNSMVTVAADKLSKVLVQESAVLSGAARQVEWIERELRIMQAFLEHVDHDDSGSSDEWAEKLRSVARDAEDAIETFVIKSVKRRRRGLLYWYDKYKVGKELERISDIMRDISQHHRQTRLDLTFETPGPAETSATIVTPALHKFIRVLSHNLITRRKGIKVAERVRDELVGMQNIVRNLESTSQREKVWLEEVKEVCDYTAGVADSFIAHASRERWCKTGKLCSFVSEREFKKQMMYVRTQIGDALQRRMTYGVGGKDMRDEIILRSSPVPNLSPVRLIISRVMFILYYIIVSPVVPLWTDILGFFFLITLDAFIRDAKPAPKPRGNVKKMLVAFMFLMLAAFIEYAFLFLSRVFYNWLGVIQQLFSFLYKVIVWTVSLWRSMDKNLKSTQRDLALMHALFTDIEGMRLNERQKVWVDQLRVVAQNACSLHAERGRGGVFRRIIFAKNINDLLNEILNVTDRKIIYGIADIQGRQGTVSSSGSTEQLPHPRVSYQPISGLREKVQSIRGEMDLMNALFGDVGEIEGRLDGRSKMWVKQMRDIAGETESVINDYANKLEHKPIHIQILHYLTRRDIIRKINGIRDKIEDVSRRRKAYGLVQLQTRAESSSMLQILRRRTRPSLVVKQSSIVGFDDDVLILTAQLLTDEQRRCIISIVGIQGSGKTTLAGLIFDNDAVTGHFDCRIKVFMPPNEQIEVLLQDIAKEAAKQFMRDQDEEQGWSTQDVLRTLASTMYLLVVDGIESSQVLDAVKKSIPDMSTACRVVLTGRNASAELHAGTRTFVHPLQLLDDKNSWTLFRRNLNADIPRELEKVGKEIVKKCGGLPLEILETTDLLSTKDATIEEWSSELNQDQKHWLETCNAINSLPLYLRRCLFYFLLFPAEFGIPARRLVALWVAEGLVHQGEDKEPPEEIAGRYLTELIDLNMVQIAKRKQNGTAKTCRLPRALREFWLTKANESRFLRGRTATDTDDVQKNSIIRQVADHLDERDIWHNHIHSDSTSVSGSATLRTHYKDVLSFLSFDAQEGSKPGEDVGNFLKRCISSNCFLLLRVLDLERVYKPRLPKNIARLSGLRYLGLRWTYLESLPSSISSLLKLQTLDLTHTYIHILTSSIWKMELRHLFLSETYRSRFPPKPKVNSSLSDLQTLWGLFVDEETAVKGGLDKLIGVRKLGLACQQMSPDQKKMESQLEAVADWIMKLEHLHSLRLKSRDEEGRPWNLHLKSLQNHVNLTDMYLLGILSCSSILSQFPPSLVELNLSHSKLEEDPMQILKDLPNLRSLSLLAESYLGRLMVCNSQSFLQLHVLKLWKLEQLEEWKIEQQALPSLRQLEIRSCRRMKTLPDGLKHVNSLLELKLTTMPMEINIHKHNIPPHCEVYIDSSE
ncbi:probable disease resistance protein RF9 [Abrus precatorius]|uniref:Probable disease resistance protein RF9 n=1 Tax=Abrus precatorius TaxID=3816 RepID=A0A8B8MC02_ABRPR|nr:probable disease resistance protein RF9 [Abrus precatorius]